YLAFGRSGVFSSEANSGLPLGQITGTAFTVQGIGAWVSTVPAANTFAFNLRSCTGMGSSCSDVSTTTCTIATSTHSCTVGSLSAAIANNVFLDLKSVASTATAQTTGTVSIVGYIP